MYQHIEEKSFRKRLWEKGKMFSMQNVSDKPSIATFHLSAADSMSLGRSQNGVLGNGLTPQLQLGKR